MESWSIQIDKEYFTFSAAHFLIFPDGSAERLHGHNYRVFVEIEARLTSAGLVLDFQRVKPVVRELVDDLDEYLLLPGEHPDVRIGERDDGVVEVWYGDAYYAAPRGDVRVLPINNTSVENFAAYLGRELRERLVQCFEDLEISRLAVSVQETLGQRGTYHFAPD
jgi:6-pyruvoyltetrahydropterin/6-carboxytetrahydropterin synthase